MSVFDQMSTAMKNRDNDAFLALLHDEFVFVRHQSGTEMNKADMAVMLDQMSASDGWSLDNHRCVYENEDILVEHSVMSFPDGTREAILSSNMLKDGKIIRMETGASPLG